MNARLLTASTTDMPTAARVLVVDDHLQARQSMVDILRQAGYQVDCCASAVEGLAMLATESFDVIITD